MVEIILQEHVLRCTIPAGDEGMACLKEVHGDSTQAQNLELVKFSARALNPDNEILLQAALLREIARILEEKKMPLIVRLENH